MNTTYVFLAILIISLISFIGALTVALAEPRLKRLLIFLVSFSAGALLGDTFLHLLPETIEEFGFTTASALYLIVGILIFFIIEKFLHWQHCHEVGCEHHHRNPALAPINLIGDAFHNLLDGIIIAGSFLAGPAVGLATTIAVALHEIPQEIGDFGILLHSGLSRARALFLNFISALFAFLGAGLFFLLASQLEAINQVILPLTAGGFLYIALADLVPELHRERTLSRSALQLASLVLGIAVMFLLLGLE